MTDKETLFNLMGYCSTIEGYGEDLARDKVGFLIANGVTIKKYGRWIPKTGRAMCSCCADECWADSVIEYNYCPNCGAKMDGERKNDGK